jgi:plastocyanin
MGESAGSPTDSLMMSFTRSMRGIEKSLQTGSADLATDYALALSQAAKRVDLSEFHFDSSVDRFTFARHIKTTVQIAQLIELSANKADLPAAREELTNLRRTCISCHVLLDVDSYGSYPSDGNILTGVVDILKMDGERRSNCSDVVVFVDRVVRDSVAYSSQTKRTFSQRNRAFMPRVMPVVRGAVVEFPNDDTIFHNVFSLSRTLPFDLDIYPPGETKELVFPTTGWVKVYCNIHPNMIGHIIVLDNCFFSMTDEWGRFVISGLPDGTYDLRVWHEFAPDAVRTVVLEEDEIQRQKFLVRENRMFVQHKDKLGRPYRRRYE